MNNLNGLVVYLSGPIECLNDHGVGFRQEIIEKTQHLHLRYLDPTNKGAGFISEVGKEKTTTRELRKQERWDDLTDKVKQIRRFDLRCVDLCDFMITYIDPDIHMCGTYDELFTVEDQKKANFVICKGGKARLPLWLFAAVKHTEVFSNVDELVEHLNLLNRTDLSNDRRWVLIRPEISRPVEIGAGT